MTAGSDGSILVRSRATGEALVRMEGLARGPSSIAASPDGRELLTLTAEDGLGRWSVATGERVARVDLPYELASVNQPGAYRPRLRVSPDGRRVALFHQGNGGWKPLTTRVTLVDLATGRARECDPPTGQGRPRMPRDVAFDARGESLRVLFGRADAEGPFACATYVPGDGEPRDLLLREAPRGAATWLSRDGLALWCAWQEGGEHHARVAPVDAPEGAAARRWSLGAAVPREGFLQRNGFLPQLTTLAGVAVGAVVTAGVGDDPARLWLLARNGRSRRGALPPGARLLDFAPDDRALWALDTTGLVVELTVPDELLEAP